MSRKTDAITERVVLEARYIITHKSTVRKAGQALGICKSVVHYDMVNRLPYVNKTMSCKVNHILSWNKQMRHERGGQATADKWHKIIESRNVQNGKRRKNRRPIGKNDN